MIRLITGLPGAGKSLRGVQLIKRYLGEGRNVYVDGIDGLQPFGWESCDARNWEALPDGSVIVVDEAQKVWPTRSGSSAIPPEIRALSEHRHRGFDFVLLTQHPTMLDAYVRKLVGEHEHVLRQFGMQASRIVTWTECQDDPQSLGTRQRGTDALWKYPTDCYPLYKSATLHTVKRKLPFRVIMIPVLILAVAALVWWGTNSVSSMGAAPSFGGETQGLASAADPVAKSRHAEVRYASPEEYVQAFVPRVPALPWSAPAFDQREVRAEPRVLCVISEMKGCRCYTEQVTRLNVPARECFAIARDGIYDPFRMPLEAQPPPPPQQPAAQEAPPAVAKYQALPVPTNGASVMRSPISPGRVWPDR